jgi:hypothetical protein
MSLGSRELAWHDDRGPGFHPQHCKKKKKKKKGGGVGGSLYSSHLKSQIRVENVVEHLPSNSEALSSNPSANKKN